MNILLNILLHRYNGCGNKRKLSFEIKIYKKKFIKAAHNAKICLILFQYNFFKSSYINSVNIQEKHVKRNCT